MPKGWTPINDSGKRLSIAFWNLQEFLLFVEVLNPRKGLDWVRPSYSQAYYLLAFIALEENQLETAMSYIDAGILLEPDHPHLLIEKGNILGKMKCHEEAFEIFKKAESARKWILNSSRVIAMRGQAINLINLGKLNDAEAILLKSIRIEPEDTNSQIKIQKELSIINKLQQGEKVNLDLFLVN